MLMHSLDYMAAVIREGGGGLPPAGVSRGPGKLGRGETYGTRAFLRSGV
jgi:hypothetical protein